MRGVFFPVPNSCLILFSVDDPCIKDVDGLCRMSPLKEPKFLGTAYRLELQRILLFLDEAPGDN